MDIAIQAYLGNFSFILLFLVVIFCAKWLYNFTSKTNNFIELTDKKNFALAISIAGFIAAVTIIFTAVLIGPSKGLITDLINVSLYTALGMLLLLISRIINDKIILHSFCNKTHLTEQQSVSVGIVQAASYLTSALVIGGALKGEGSLLSALVFYSLGQALLVVFAKLYDVITKFDLIAQLKLNNVAAAIAFSATLVATGIILLHALTGKFVSWQESLVYFILDAVVAFVILPIVRILIDKLMLPSVNIDCAIEHDQNMAVAIIEAVAALSVAIVIFFTL